VVLKDTVVSRKFGELAQVEVLNPSRESGVPTVLEELGEFLQTLLNGEQAPFPTLHGGYLHRSAELPHTEAAPI